MGLGLRGGMARQLQGLLEVGALGSLDDGDLLGRYLVREQTAEMAFRTLVERHSRMVLRICRDVLGDSHEAQDAAQATFFILARKAGSIRNPDALPSWLHGTARRVATRALRDTIRRRRHERRSAEVAANSAGSVADAAGSWAELHEELSRLPDRYREPIILCDLAGLTHEQAAVKLGCPPRTLETRLYRGRDRLKGLLIRRGLAPASALVGLVWGWEAQAAVLTPAWFDSTAGAAVHIAAKVGWAASGEVPFAAVRWARMHLGEVAMMKLKWVASACLLVGGFAGGAWSWMIQDRGKPSQTQAVVHASTVVLDDKAKPRDAFEQAYTLTDVEDIKALFGPSIEARNEHYRGKWPELGFSADPFPNQSSRSIFFRWRDGKLIHNSTTSDSPKLRDLFGFLMEIRAQEVEGDPTLLDSPVPADFIVREGLTAARLVPQVETILRRDFHLPARLSLKLVFREVVVVGGRYRYQKAAELKTAPDGLTSGGDRIEVSAGKLGGDYKPGLDHFSSGATFEGFLSTLGLFLGRRVVNEVKQEPNVRFDFCITDFRLKKELSPEERARTMKNVSDQMGLTFTEEPRLIRVLQVDRVE